MNHIIDLLFLQKDDKNAIFCSRLIPNVKQSQFLGVRIPALRKIAKSIDRDEFESFLSCLPHKYYDEYILHSILISEIKDFDECIEKIDAFLPHVDNWAVCDALRPKAFRGNEKKVFEKIKKWASDEKTYTIRFAVEMLMKYFLEDNFEKCILEIPISVKSENYYVKMMIAWFFAESLVKRWDDTISYIENKRLDFFTHNKTIQKSIESYRISDEKKKYLRNLKIVR